MRTTHRALLTARCIAALVAVLWFATSGAAQPQSVVDFDFNIVLDPTGGAYGPYEFANVFFVAHPTAPAAQLTYTISYSPQFGSCLESATTSVPISNLRVTEAGKLVLTGGYGSFGYSAGGGSPNPQCTVFFDQSVGFGASSGKLSVGIGGLTDIYIPNWQAALSSRDPLYDFLAGSSFNTTGFMSCSLPGLPTVSGFEGECFVTGGAETVPEPSYLVLLLAGLGMLVLNKISAKSAS
jgi:hypothetical protein